jgi:hypothetical protein
MGRGAGLESLKKPPGNAKTRKATFSDVFPTFSNWFVSFSAVGCPWICTMRKVLMKRQICSILIPDFLFYVSIPGFEPPVFFPAPSWKNSCRIFSSLEFSKSGKGRTWYFWRRRRRKLFDHNDIRIDKLIFLRKPIEPLIETVFNRSSENEKKCVRLAFQINGNRQSPSSFFFSLFLLKLFLFNP